MKKQIKSPLIAGKGMQLFSDEEMMPRKTMTQQEFEEYILPYSADIVDAIESAYSESKKLCNSYSRHYQNRNFESNNLNSFVQGKISDIPYFECGEVSGNARRFYSKVGVNKLFFKKVDKFLRPSGWNTKKVQMYNEQKTTDVSDTFPITYIGYQVDKSNTSICGIYAIHMENGKKEWVSNIVDLAFNASKVISVLKSNNDASVTIKKQKKRKESF